MRLSALLFDIKFKRVFPPHGNHISMLYVSLFLQR
ncbi:hypothetical protein T4B_4984 [Trichinella pseudospiralis]|uniref:Uncharacterized protein n=1 Tax=Trichinella pseudospiralis TaxID=6337 RepID=A0A0V1G9Z2_TRIPS|nr:hypothetical protein T4B_4984 [Trichinella pseudospiralis]